MGQSFYDESGDFLMIPTDYQDLWTGLALDNFGSTISMDSAHGFLLLETILGRQCEEREIFGDVLH